VTAKSWCRETLLWPQASSVEWNDDESQRKCEKIVSEHWNSFVQTKLKHTKKRVQKRADVEKKSNNFDSILMKYDAWSINSHTELVKTFLLSHLALISGVKGHWHVNTDFQFCLRKNNKTNENTGKIQENHKMQLLTKVWKWLKCVWRVIHCEMSCNNRKIFRKNAWKNLFHKMGTLQKTHNFQLYLEFNNLFYEIFFFILTRFWLRKIS
jgi:hypothetical protein